MRYGNGAIAPALSAIKRIGAVVALLTLITASCGSDDGEAAILPESTVATTTVTTEGARTSENITVAFFDGQWRGSECLCTIVFENGRYEVLVVGTRGLDTVDQGEISLTDNLMTFVSNEGSDRCQAGDEWVAQYGSLAPSDSGTDRVQLIRVSDDCDRGTLGTAQGNLQADGNLYEVITRSP